MTAVLSMGCPGVVEDDAGPVTGDDDAGAADAGATDAGGTDAGTTDAGTTDAGSSDAGSTDAGSTDAGGSDAGGSDAGGSDAGSVEPWAPAFYTSYNHSGSRLVAKAVTDDSGNSVVLYFEDTLLGVRCNPYWVQNQGLQELRCVPELTQIENDDVVYLDDGCQQVAAVMPAACDDATLVRLGQTLYEASLVSAGAPVYLSSFGTCVEIAVSSAGYPVAGLAPVDVEDYVLFTPAVVPVSDEIGVRVLEGSDGSSVAVGLWSLGVDRGLRVVEQADVLRAVPENPFRDGIASYVRSAPEYTQPNAFLAEDLDTLPPFVNVLIYPPLIPSHWINVTNKYDTYWDGANQVADPSGRKVYTLGAPAILSGQPALEVAEGAGPNVNLDHYTLADGTPLLPKATLAVGGAFSSAFPIYPSESVVDVNVAGQAVVLMRLGDDVLPVPATTAWPVAQYYEDDSCQATLALAALYQPGDLVATEARDSCGVLPGAPSRIAALRTVSEGTPTSPPAYGYDQNTRDCMSVGLAPEDMRATQPVTDVSGLLSSLVLASLPVGD